MKTHSFFDPLRITMWLVAAFCLGVIMWSWPAQAETEWLWSERVSLVNRSTEALAAGHTQRAERFARAARATALPAPERLVAIHNLCLALVMRSKAGADVECRAALRMTVSRNDDRLVRKRGALLVGVADNAQYETLRLSEIVRANIARAYGVLVVDHMSEGTTAELW